MKTRISAYIDGFNFYRGMCDAGWRHLLWLDFTALANRILPPDSTCTEVKYVTARILNLHRDRRSPEYLAAEASRLRQSRYIDALKAMGVIVFEGKFKRRTVSCRACGANWPKPEEKASDVHLATQLLCDAFRDRFDRAIVISGDADSAPAIEVVTQQIKKPVTVAFPPKRISDFLRSIATDSRHVNKQEIAKSQLPDRFTYEGHVFQRPVEWGGRP